MPTYGGRPTVTVSPVGTAAGYALANNGADFGPDTPGTSTYGLQEWLNYIGATGAVGIAVAGTYLLSSPLNFATAFPSGVLGARVDLSGATLQPTSTFSGAALVLLIGPSYANQLFACDFRFGRLQNPSSYSSPSAGMIVSDVAVCLIAIQDIAQFGNATNGGSGILLTANYYGSNQDAVFNNIFHIGRLAQCGNGLGTNGNPASPPTAKQVSGNVIHIGQVTLNAQSGIKVDGNGTGKNTQYNTFIVGVVEHNTGPGILDQNGGNIYIVSNTNSNGTAGVQTPVGSANAPLLIGQFTDGVSMYGPSRILDVSIAPGWISSPPAPPTATGVSHKVTNLFTATVRIFQAESSISALGTHIIDASGTDTALPKDPPEVLLDPGCSIYYATAVPGSWAWFRS